MPHMECPSQMDTPLLVTLPQHKLAKPEQATEPWSIYEFSQVKNVNL